MQAARTSIRLASLIVTMQLSACAMTPTDVATCDTAGAQRPPYALVARNPRPEPAAAESPRVTRYRLTLDQHQVSPCASLRLRKEVTFVTSTTPRPSIWEIQDFFAGNGTFIARHSEDISTQLARSGRYARTIVLPVPQSTPPGRYRVVSRLVVKQNGREMPLASASSEFSVSRAPTSESRVRPETSR